MKRLIEFFQEDNGKLSSARLLSVMVVIAFLIEWMHAVFFMTGIYSPDYGTIGLIVGLFGVKAIQKKAEQTVDRNQNQETNNSEIC